MKYEFETRNENKNRDNNWKYIDLKIVRTL